MTSAPPVLRVSWSKFHRASSDVCNVGPRLGDRVDGTRVILGHPVDHERIDHHHVYAALPDGRNHGFHHRHRDRFGPILLGDDYGLIWPLSSESGH